MKIIQLRTELFHAVGQTDMTNLIVTFRNFEISLKSYVN